MSPSRLLLLGTLLLLGGCTWPVREKTDQVLRDLASHPFDVAPAKETSQEKPKTEDDKPAATNAQESEPATDTQTTAWMQSERRPVQTSDGRPKYDLKIPSTIPGSEARPLDFKNLTPEQKQQAIRQLYPELPSLPAAPTPQPGPNDRPYTLADLQKIAAEKSPTLRQAVADVKSAEGALLQARTYQNPSLGYSAAPTNNNSNAGAQGTFVTQHLVAFGKRNLQVAAAQKDLDNAQLALRRARYDLATAVRTAYVGVIVA
jgi:cobalt-zinc-cadmium efflux system outer membrane protein